jgi:cysteine desulfurase
LSLCWHAAGSGDPLRNSAELIMRRIYLDFNATTPVAPSVQEAMLPFLTEHYGDPSAAHATGRACQEAIDDARTKVAELIGADQEEIVFTASGCESNNLAIKGIVNHISRQDRSHLVISSLEHASVSEPARYLRRLGYDVSIVPCNASGVIEPEAIEAAIRRDTALVSVMHASGDTGVIQPIREIAEVCQSHNVLMHSDAAQSLGKIPVNVNDTRVDLLTLSAHKIYGPKGIGALYVRHGVALEPLLHGDYQENGLRSGVENTPAIVGMGCAAALARRGIDGVTDRMAMLRDRLYNRLCESIKESVFVAGQQSCRLPNTLAMALPRTAAQEILIRTPEISAKSIACNSAASTGLPSWAHSLLRLSVGWQTSEEDIDLAASLLAGAWESSPM